MIIGSERQPRLQVGEREPQPVDSCEIRREIDRSVLTAVRAQSEPVRFVPGSSVTLWASGSIVFQGRAISETEVLDLMSSETDGELPPEQTI